MSITGNLKSYELTILLSKKQKLRLTKSWDWATYVGKTGIFGDNSIAPNHRDTGLLSIVSIQSCQYTMELKNKKFKKTSNFCQKPPYFLAVTRACVEPYHPGSGSHQSRPQCLRSLRRRVLRSRLWQLFTAVLPLLGLISIWHSRQRSVGSKPGLELFLAAPSGWCEVLRYKSVTCCLILLDWNWFMYDPTSKTWVRDLV